MRREAIIYVSKRLLDMADSRSQGSRYPARLRMLGMRGLRASFVHSAQVCRLHIVPPRGADHIDCES